MIDVIYFNYNKLCRVLSLDALPSHFRDLRPLSSGVKLYLSEILKKIKHWVGGAK